MKRNIWLMALLAATAFTFCSKNTEEPAAGSENMLKKPARSKASTAARKVIHIKKVSLIPEVPTVLDNMTAVPQLAESSLGNVNFQYQWFVMDTQVPAAVSATLEKTNFKKGAVVHCLVKATAADGESSWHKSEIKMVGNALPVLNLAPVPACEVPGVFRYKIKASDPDNDELTFTVAGPENEGISLEVESGLLTWKINRDIIKRLGEPIAIQFDVIDSDGGKTRGSITLNLGKTK